MNRLDKIDVLWRLNTLLPNHASEHIRIFHQLENESSAWSTYSPLEFKTRVDLRLEALCRNFREENVSAFDARRRDCDSVVISDGFGGRHVLYEHEPISRAEVLRQTADIVLDFNLETEKRDEKVYVNLTPYHSEKKFTIGTLEHSWFPYFKRLHRGLFLKDNERMFVRTTKEVNHFGKTVPREVPVISIAAANKYGVPNYDDVLLSAETVNTNQLDLTFANIRIPSLERTKNTIRQNEDLLKKSVCGQDDSRVWDKSAFEWGDGPVRPKGEGPNSDLSRVDLINSDHSDEIDLRD
jgi:hypothetical protein